MNTAPQHQSAACLGSLGLAMVLLLSGCFGCRFVNERTVDLISHPLSTAALQKGDLAEARHILEPLLAAMPSNAELSYTLGCVYLVQSEKAVERGLLQTRGWQLVDAASGRHFPADMLLALVYRTGFWGRRQNPGLALKHAVLWQEEYKTEISRPEMKDCLKRVWKKLPKLLPAEDAGHE